MPGVLRTVERLRLAAQHRFHDQCLFGRVRNVLEHAVEQARRDHLPQCEFLALRGQIFAEGEQLLAARLFVHAVDHRRGLGLERLGRRDIGSDHEILDHAMRIEPFADGDFLDHARVVEADLPFGQFEIERVTGLPRLEQQLPRAPQVLEVFGRVAGIDRRLRVFIGDVLRQAHDGAREAPVADLAILVDADVTGHRRPVDILLEAADIGAEHFG